MRIMQTCTQPTQPPPLHPYVDPSCVHQVLDTPKCSQYKRYIVKVARMEGFTLERGTIDGNTGDAGLADDYDDEEDQFLVGEALTSCSRQFKYQCRHTHPALKPEYTSVAQCCRHNHIPLTCIPEFTSCLRAFKGSSFQSSVFPSQQHDMEKPSF